MNGVVFFEHINYQGRSWTFDGDQAFVGDDANDQFSSVRVPPGVSVTLFQHRDFGGSSVTLTADTPDLRDKGFNDSASSVKFSGSGAEKAVRLKRNGQFVECNTGGTISLVGSKSDAGKVQITKHDDKRYDVLFLGANKTLSIEPDGSLTSRPAGTYGAFEQLAATTQPAPDVIDLLYRVADGQILGAALQIVEE